MVEGFLRANGVLLCRVECLFGQSSSIYWMVMVFCSRNDVFNGGIIVYIICCDMRRKKEVISIYLPIGTAPEPEAEPKNEGEKFRKFKKCLLSERSELSLGRKFLPRKFLPERSEHHPLSN